MKAFQDTLYPLLRDAVADMIPEVPRGVDAGTEIAEQQILAWIEADRAALPDAEQEFVKHASFHVLRSTT